jgi:uncharacterized phage-associated protein
MNSIPFNEEKALAAVLYVVKNLGGQVDMYKLAKILYFADQKHLVTYGRTIIGDEYVPMKYGPVPSGIYNAIKELDNPILYKLFAKNLQRSVTENGYINISHLAEPDMDELSLSDVECLDSSINENRMLSFNNLCKKSHNLAWTNAKQEKLPRLRIEDIAKEAGANDDFIAYIKECAEDYNLSLA